MEREDKNKKIFGRTLCAKLEMFMFQTEHLIIERKGVKNRS